MNRRLTDAVESVRSAAERHADTGDRAAEFPVEAVSAMRATGVLGLPVPTDHGGLGGSVSDVVDVTLALGRVDMSVAMIFGMHCQQVLVVAKHGGQRLVDQVLPDIAAGEVYLASVTTEPGTGGHLLTSDSTTTLLDGGAVRIDREAPIVTGGRHADAFLVTVRAPDAQSPAQVSLVYAARDQVQADVCGGWDPLGMRATESVAMRLTGSVPAHQVIGADSYRRIATTMLAPVAHIVWSAAWLGTAVGAYGRVVRHVRDPAGRRQFDPSSDLLLHRLAATRARLDVVHALLRHTVRVFESGVDVAAGPVQMLLNTLKTQSADDCFSAAHELVELTGMRHGYLPDSSLGLERAFRDLRSASLNYGNDRLRLASGALALMDAGVHLA